MSRLDGRIAIVTGASRGIGAEICSEFIMAGAVVVGADITFDEGGFTATDGAWRHHLDVTDPESWRRLVDSTSARFGPPTVLVNNAGIVRYGSVRDQTLEDFRAQFDVNSVGTFLGISAVADSMTTAGVGAIVNIGSLTAVFSSRRAIGYAASKWAVRGITRSAALELGPSGIRVNCIHPGWVDTEIHQGGTPGSRVAPVGRRGLPSDVAKTALFLASAESAFVNGADHVVDGGQHVAPAELAEP